MAEATAALEAVQRDAAGLRAEADALQKAMDDVGGDALRAQRATVKALTEGIAEAAEATLEKRAIAASHAKATARVSKAIEEASAERAQLTEDVKATKEAFATLEDEAMSVMETQKTTQLAVDEKAGALANVAAPRSGGRRPAARHVEVEIERLDDPSACGGGDRQSHALDRAGEADEGTEEQLEEMKSALLAGPPPGTTEFPS